MDRLKDKVAIITGAASGMGAEEAKLFAAEGAKVLLADLNEDKLKKVTEEILNDGGIASYFVLDVVSEEGWEDLVSKVIATYGSIDILINNAGIAGPSVGFEASNLTDFNAIVTINLNSQYLGIKAVAPEMIKKGEGVIVNISSTAGLVAAPGMHPGYPASKGGSRLLTKAAAAEYASQNIRVNSVHPGMVGTPLLSATLAPEIIEQASATIPMKRMAAPMEIAKAVLFLASDEASYITGTELVVDGGYTCV